MSKTHRILSAITIVGLSIFMIVYASWCEELEPDEPNIVAIWDGNTPIVDVNSQCLLWVDQNDMTHITAEGVELIFDGPNMLITDDSIKHLCNTGRVCEAIGHKWVNTSDYSYGCAVYGCTDDHADYKKTCSICGKIIRKIVVQEKIERWE